jgi:ubiquinone/menaquinone biosynthesis C-methylase UbiE
LLKGDNPLAKSKSEFLFNTIAPVYGLFYNWQKKRSFEVFEKARGTLDLSCYDSIIDVGCGTGALCAVLSDRGLEVTGVDPAEKMLGIAKRKAGNRSIRFETGNVLEILPFDDKSFDIAIASYVAHGMGGKERRAMYEEMSRIARHRIIIYDYNQKKSILTTFVEWLEKGDYPNFIKNVENEMRRIFPQVDVIQVTRQANWYICTPIEESD